MKPEPEPEPVALITDEELRWIAACSHAERDRLAAQAKLCEAAVAWHARGGGGLLSAATAYAQAARALEEIRGVKPWLTAESRSSSRSA